MYFGQTTKPGYGLLGAAAPRPIPREKTDVKVNDDDKCYTADCRHWSIKNRPSQSRHVCYVLSKRWPRKFRFTLLSQLALKAMLEVRRSIDRLDAFKQSRLMSFQQHLRTENEFFRCALGKFRMM